MNTGHESSPFAHCVLSSLPPESNCKWSDDFFLVQNMSMCQKKHKMFTPILLAPQKKKIINPIKSINRVTLDVCSASGWQVISSLRSWLTTSTGHHAKHWGHKTFLCSSHNSWVPEKWIKSVNASLIFMLHSGEPKWPLFHMETTSFFRGSNLPKLRTNIASCSRFIFVIAELT